MEDFNHKISFVQGPKIELLSNHSDKYLIEFYERFGEDWALVHTEHRMNPYTWFKHLRTFRTEWRIKIWGWRQAPVLLVDHIYNEQGKTVYLQFDSNRFETQLNWYLKAKQFAANVGCNLIIESKFADRLKSTAPSGTISLIDQFKTDQLRQSFINNSGLYAMYFVGRKEIESRAHNWWESGAIFENHGRHYKSYDHPVDWVSIPDEKLFESILGL